MKTGKPWLTSNTARNLGSILPYTIIILASVVMFAPFLFQEKVFFPADLLYANYPWKASAGSNFRPHNDVVTDPLYGNYAAIYNRQLHQGGLKNWNPYLLMGMPNTGATAMSGMPGRWYPLKLLLHRLFSAPIALNFLLFIHVTVMGLSMCLFLKEIGTGRRGALFGAIAYMFSGVAMVWLECEGTVAAGTLLPLLLLCMERFMGRRRLLHAFLGAGILGLLCLMGNLQYLLYTYLMILLYCCFLVWRMYHRQTPMREVLELLLCCGITCALGTLIGGIEILPTAELIGNSARIRTPYTFSEYFSVLGRIPFRQFVALVFPDYFGGPLQHLTALPIPPSQKHLNFCELALYMGIPTLFASLACLVRRRRSHVRFFLFMTVLFALLMTGTVAYYPFFMLVPGMDKLTPTRIVWLFTFSAVVAAAFGIGEIPRFSGRRRWLYLSFVLLLTAAIATLALASSSRPLISFFDAEAIASVPGIPWQRLLPDLRRVGSPVILKPLMLTLASAALFALLALARRKWQQTLLFFSILGLLAFELIGAARNFNTVVDPTTMYPRTPGIDYLLRQKPPFRVIQDGAMGAHPMNTLAPFGIEEVGGYSSVYPEHITYFVSFIKYGFRASVDRWVRFNNFRSPLLDLVNAKYILTLPGSRLGEPRLGLVYRGRDMDIYENRNALPRAFAVHRARVVPDTFKALEQMGSSSYDMRNEVVLAEQPDRAFVDDTTAVDRPPVVVMEEHAEDTVSLSADLAANGWLILTDTHYPGWKVYVDGVEAPILRANVNFRAVPLRGGAHRVIFRFRPVSVRAGGLITLAGVLATFVGIFWAGVWRRDSPARPSAPNPAPEALQ